jgi:hypothetical protein
MSINDKLPRPYLKNLNVINIPSQPILRMNSNFVPV